MDISKKFTNLTEIAWPVFRLADRKPDFKDGLSFFFTHYVNEHNEETGNMRIIDDKSYPQKTLGLRRLAMQLDEVNLYPIRTAIYFLADLIKLGKAATWFVDNSGRVFQYEKNTRAKLITKKIKQILPADGLGCVVELEGISSRFKCMRRPNEFQSYARVLKFGMGFIFYGFCEEVKPDSWRMV